MILKGNQRGGGSQLAAHLLNSFDNERVEIVDIRGAIAQDLSGAFDEWYAQSRATNCQKYLYSLSLNPDQTQGRLTREQYLELLERTERSLKLVGQPRAVVFHEKRDKDGVLREHCHAVWSRIDTDRMKAVQIAHDRLKLRTVAQGFARDHGLDLPDGLKPRESDDRDRFNNRARQENLGEKQQQERTGISKAQRMAEIASCWTNTSNGAAFVGALEDKGYFLARGDRRAYVVVDLYGEVHSLSRQLAGTAKGAQLKERLAGYPLGKLSDVEAARAYAKQRLLERQKAPTPADPQKSDEAEIRREILKARQAERRAGLAKMRVDLLARHFAERGALRDMQAATIDAVAARRLENQPKGVLAFLSRITGIDRAVCWARNQADTKRQASHKRQTQALLDRQGRELKEVNRHYRALDRLERREDRSAANAVLRENFGKLRARSFALKPEFDQALVQPRAATAAGDSAAGKLVALFKRVVQGSSLNKGDLQAAFERAATARAIRSGGNGGNAAPAPSSADAEKLEEARRISDELKARQSRQDKQRDRER